MIESRFETIEDLIDWLTKEYFWLLEQKGPDSTIIRIVAREEAIILRMRELGYLLDYDKKLCYKESGNIRTYVERKK